MMNLIHNYVNYFYLISKGNSRTKIQKKRVQFFYHQIYENLNYCSYSVKTLSFSWLFSKIQTFRTTYSSKINAIT